ncbi:MULTISPECIES: DUF6082 family protein [unclassified Streptomyces]|uniref:DUF6082 family protein n=1 Tax=unclassified Streptomyces TaxID=2593676 RepID=UPI0006B0415A|nr:MULTISPECIES: DUF6082 family protein [unclassified Streptomyces]KOX33018.1 hypothetical protein ADL06_09725 [Streptomyces sp. NRRL F-6491]KOX49518.1 hypothetical protein ADL08_08420 [Streptomyces sp. NRRL F-6492]
MKTSKAILIATATVAVGILNAGRLQRGRTELAEKHHQETIELSREQHQQRLRLDTAALHQRLLAAIATDPEHCEIWNKGDITPEELANMVRVNRQISLNHLTFELGLTSPEKLLVQARSLMERPIVRDFWGKTRDFRSQESDGEATQTFIEILDREYAAAATEKPVVNTVA